MTNYQTLFDDIVLLLQKNTEKHDIVKQCLNDCALELSFTPPKTDTTVSKSTLLDIYKRTDKDAYDQLYEWFSGSTEDSVIIWYLDTENVGYTVFTNKDCTELAGIKTSPQSLQEIREQYFIQKENLEKIGEQPAYKYDEKEITFINKQWVK